MNQNIKPALHHSMLATLSKCGMQVYYRWVENIKIPPSFALHVGSAVHRAAELDLRRKMETGQQAHLAEVVDRARDSLGLAVEGDGVLLSPEEKTVGIKTLVAEAQDEAASLARLHHAELTPVLAPIAVEKKMRLELGGFPFDLEGTVDVQETKAIFDLKTASRAPGESDAEGHPQLETYAMMLSKHGETAETIGLNTLVKSKTGKPKLARVTARAPRVYDHVVRRIEAAAHTIQAGAFYPADPTGPSGWVCTEKFCGYWNLCPFGRARRVSVSMSTNEERT